jgi:hypothetical protein
MSYEGEGTIQLQTTCWNHAQDDKHREREREINSYQSYSAATGSRTIDTGTNTECSKFQMLEKSWIRSWEQEVLWLSELPLTSPTAPLVFVNNPLTHGEYKSPSISDSPYPNSGLHALDVRRHPNAAFLATENHFFELLGFIESMKQFHESVSLLNRLFDELSRLDRQKELQWAQQQAELTPGKFIVNTGPSLYYPSTLSLRASLDPYFYRLGPLNPTSRIGSIVSLIMELFFFYTA